MKNILASLLCAPALHPAPCFENTLEAQKTKITALEADLVKANASIVKRDVTITSLTTERDTAAAEVTRLTGELETANGTITASNETITTHLATIDTLKGEATTTEKKAARLLATQGHAALKITPSLSQTKVEEKAVARKGASKLEAAIEAGLEKAASK